MAMVIVALFSAGMWMRAAQSTPAAPRAKGARKAAAPEKVVMPENFHPPEVTLSLASASGKEVEVDLTMVNHGPDNFRVLKWNLPDGEELSNNLFTITRDGREVAYHGRMVKRRVTPESYLALLPDKEYTVRIKLSPGYDVSAPGHYQMHYQVLNQSAPDADKVVLTLLKSNKLEWFK